MRFIPKMEFNIQTSQSKDYVLRKLKVNTHPDQKIPRYCLPRYSEPFYGQVGCNNFLVCPVTQYSRNSFLPVINGEVFDNDDGAVVHVCMKMYNLVQAFWITWLSLALVFFVSIFVTFIANNQQFQIGVFVPLFLFGYGYCLGYFAFRFNARSARRKMEELLVHPLTNRD